MVQTPSRVLFSFKNVVVGNWLIDCTKKLKIISYFMKKFNKAIYVDIENQVTKITSEQ